MRIVINRKNTLWTLLMSVMLIMSLTITSFADSNNATQEYDGSHAFTKSGEKYGDSTYLNWYDDIHGREYKITLPADGKLQIDLTVDKGAFLDVSVNKEGSAEDEWIEVCGSARGTYNGTLTTSILSAGTYSVWFAFNHDPSDEKLLLSNEELWGYHKLSFNMTFRSLTADEQAAFEVQKKIEALPDKLTLSDAAKIAEVKKAFDSLTETQKKHIDESRAQRLSDLSDMIERLKEEKEEKDKAKEDESTQPKEETAPQNQGQSDTQPETAVKPALSVKNLWASQHGVGKVKFKWSKKDGVKVNGWNLKYRMRKIGGNNEWSTWTTESYSARTYDVWIDIPTDYVIEIHAQATGDKTWSTGIITCPAGGRYHAMKATHVINADTKSRLPETKAGSSLIYHTALNLKVGKTIRVKPDYDYDPNIVDFNKRPKLYPQHLLYDIGDKSMITITKPDGTKYTGGIIDGVATIKATKAGKTTLIFRSPNGRTMIADVTITK